MRSITITYNNTESEIQGKPIEMLDMNEETFKEILTMIRELKEAWLKSKAGVKE